MSEPTLIQTKTSLKVTDIETGHRLRPVSAAGVATIVASIRELGQMANAIVVRQVRGKDGGMRFVLLDGAHRLAAAGELGWDEVPVRVFECTDDAAKLLEIDGNLAGAELNALDTAVFLATRKALYERLHPETLAGAFKGNQHTGKLVGDIVSFTTTTAEKFNLSRRHVERMVAAGARLGPDEVTKLRQAPRAVTLKDLQEISKIGNPVERYDVVDLLSEGLAKSAAEARKKYAAAQPDYRGPAPVDPVDAEYLALMNAFRRARKEARRRFVEDMFEELAPLVTEVSDAMLEANRAAAAEEAA